MSGHSKWANIKRQKMANDKVKGNVFGKMSKLITLAVIEGGGMTRPEDNFKLRLAIEKAHASNMPKENIKRAIEKGSGPDRSALKEIIYEGFAPYGVSIIIQTTTDNHNRTLTEIRNTMDRNNGKLGEAGSVSYMFKKCGLIIFKKTDIDEAKILEVSDILMAFDLDSDDNRYYVYFPFENLGHIKDKLKDVKYESAEVDYKPQNTISITDDEKLAHIDALLEALETLDDVHKVFTNL